MSKRGRSRKTYYSEALKVQKQAYYSALPEKAKRHFLGQEYLSLGEGSQRYLAEVFKCSRQTIKKGTDEVQSLSFNPNYERQRVKGGGRKKKNRNMSI
jgi:hypothetical protein